MRLGVLAKTVGLMILRIMFTSVCDPYTVIMILRIEMNFTSEKCWWNHITSEKVPEMTYIKVVK